jgi:benzoate/toluate 1,2-dioxygenase beta subunit
VSNASIDTQRGVEQFLYRQADILDQRRWDEWLGLFTKDGYYWMPADEAHTTGDGVPTIFYEDQFLMDMRIQRLQHPRAHSQRPKNKTSHVVSNVVIESDTGEAVTCRAKFFVAEYRNDEMRYFAGSYRHDLVRVDGGFQIKLQRVDLVNAEGPFEYVLQFWL